MPREFLTERDVEDMVKRGISSIELNDNLVLTELAYEKAQRLGVNLIAPNLKPPAAPERPYLSQTTPAPAAKDTIRSFPQSSADIRSRIMEAVKAKMGNQVDPALLDSIITRVLNQLERK